MKRWMTYLLVGAAAALMAGCSASPSLNSEAKPSLARLMKSDGIISLPYEVYGKGVYSIPLEDHTGHVGAYLVDTGATRSALFSSTVRRLDLKPVEGRTITVHGMAETGDRPAVLVPLLKVGPAEYNDHLVAVLEDRSDALERQVKPAGLIGMDVLADFRVYVDARTQTFNLIPKDLPAPKLPPTWRNVMLKPNPFNGQGNGLHFMEIRLGNHLIPALLDTGSEVNMMNWNATKFPQLRSARKRMYNNWVMEGAVGTFDPVYRIRAKNFRSGQKFWDEHEFVVMNLDSLEILGVKDEAFLIASSNLFAEQTFYIDFGEDFLSFKPADSRDHGGTLTSRTTVYQRREGEQ